jgi:hypothetical protein
VDRAAHVEDGIEGEGFEGALEEEYVVFCNDNRGLMGLWFRISLIAY